MGGVLATPSQVNVEAQRRLTNFQLDTIGGSTHAPFVDVASLKEVARRESTPRLSKANSIFCEFVAANTEDGEKKRVKL